MYRQNAASLGALESEHRLSRQWITRPVTGAILMMMIGVCLAAWMSDGFAPHNRASFSSVTEQWTVTLVVSGALFTLGVGVLVVCAFTWFSWAKIYEEGLVYRSLGRTTTVFWRELGELSKSESVHNGLELLEYRIVDLSGRRLYISRRLEGIRAIGERIEREIWMRRMPEAREAHARGEPLSFGKLTLSATGLIYKREEVAWQQIAGVRANSGGVTVWKVNEKSPLVHLPTRDVSNTPVLSSLLAQHVLVLP